jgi:hypothetical protein
MIQIGLFGLELFFGYFPEKDQKSENQARKAAGEQRRKYFRTGLCITTLSPWGKFSSSLLLCGKPFFFFAPLRLCGKQRRALDLLIV